MNLADPSGSSPPEKPPGRKTIWALRTASSRARAEAVRSSVVRFRITTVSAASPAARQARWLSYSQLVPGNTGMTTRGCAIPRPRTAGAPLVQVTGSTGSAVPARVG